MLVRVAQTAPERVLFGARAARSGGAEHGIERMRFALGVDDDLRAVPCARFAGDPLIGRSVRGGRGCGSSAGPEPFEALAWAICEQLIEYERAAAIERRLVARLGRRWSGWDGGVGERAARPADARRRSPARRRRCWSPATSRARARSRCVRAAREVARGRVDLHGADHERGWRRLRAIPGIGAWTVEMLALRGQGRHDQLPAGDLGLLQARRAHAQRRRPAGAGQRRGGARALRALRRVGGAGGGARGRAVSAGLRGSSCAARLERRRSGWRRRLRRRASRACSSSANVGQAWAARLRVVEELAACSGSASTIG